MAVHLAFIKKAVSRSIERVDHELQVSKNTQNEGAHIWDVRRKDKVVHDEDVTIHRIFVCAPDSNNMASVGWVSNKGVTFCQLCFSRFGVFTGRHHCRACGNLVCQHCSPYMTLLFGFESLGPLRTCTKCTDTEIVGPTVLRLTEGFGESIHAETARLERLAAATESNGSTPPPSSPAPASSSNGSGTAAATARPTLGGRVLSTTTSAMGAVVGAVNATTSAVVNVAANAANTAVTAANTAVSAANSAITATTGKGANAAPTAAEDAVEVVTKPVIDPLKVYEIDNPTIGFIIKTKHTSGLQAKVFINVFYHPSVEDPDLNLFQEPVSVPLTDLHNAPDDSTSEIVPNVYVACEQTVTVDRDGVSSELFNVVVNAEYFSEANVAAAVKITDAVCVQKILRVINKQFKTTINENSYVFPKVKPGTVKGEAVSVLKCHRNSHLVDIHKTVVSRNDSFVSTSTAATNITQTTSGTASGPVAGSSRRFTLGPSFGSTTSLGSQTEAQRRSQRMSMFSTSKSMNRTDSSRTHSPVGNENASVVSDASSSTAHTANGTRRFSLFPSPSSYIDRASLLSPNMMVRIERESISPDEVKKLKAEACENAGVLLGWQIYVPGSSGSEGKIFVITDMAKNTARKTEYRLSTLHQDDFWAKLKRSESKSGLEFTPLRKVLFLDKPITVVEASERDL